MRHAESTALDRLEPVLRAVREIGGLIERSRGVFYRRSKAFLHFHEDATGDFADVRNPDGDFVRFRVTDAEEQQRLVQFIIASIRVPGPDNNWRRP